MWVEREDCPYVTKMCKTRAKIVINNNSVYSLPHHNIRNKVLCADHSAMVVLAMDSQGENVSALWRPSVEVNV